ncbi:MAG: TlpA family protein disulfide reductase [Nocardioides sp.]
MRRLLTATALTFMLSSGLAACGEDSGADRSDGQSAADPAPADESAEGSTNESSDPAAPADTATADPSGGKVAKTLRFSGTTPDGKKFDGASLAGKPAVLWFWAPWCPTCRGQIPNVSALAEKYDGKVSVIGIGSLDEAGPIEEFATEVDALRHLSDPDGDVWRHFGITEQSVYVVLDADGTIVADGALGDDELNAEVAELT